MARILIHTLVFPPDAITNAYILADLARQLRGEYGHEVMVLTTTPHYNVLGSDLHRHPMTPVRGNWLLQSDLDGIPCLHIKVPPKKGGIGTRLLTALRLHTLGLWAMYRSGWKCDVVLSQSPPLSIGLVGAWLARVCGAKSVYVVQDIFPDGLVRQGKIRGRVLIGLLRALERWVYRSNHAVCGISEGFARTLRPRVPACTLLEVIPNFVNTEVYRPLPRLNDFARVRGLDKRFVVSYVGNIGNAQDFDAVFVAARACANLPISFLIVGDGMKKPALEAQARREGLSNVEFWGYQPRESTPWINASSDVTLVLLAPHVGSHGFPSKVYTLMASAKPIVLMGDPESDIAQLVTQSGAGWVVACGNHEGFAGLIQKLYHEPELLAPCGQRGWQTVQDRFTVQRVARQYHDLITRLTSSQP